MQVEAPIRSLPLTRMFRMVRVITASAKMSSDPYHKKVMKVEGTRPKLVKLTKNDEWIPPRRYVVAPEEW